MDFDEVLTKRYSVRGFLDKPVESSLVTEIVELAQRTPSWCNSQAWQLEIAGPEKTQELSERLLAHAQAGYPSEPDIEWPEKYVDVYAERRRASGYALYGSLGIARDDYDRRLEQALENHRFFGAPHVAFITSPHELGNYGLIDCGGFIATFQYAAQSRGVATIAQAAPTMYSPLVREVLSIPEGRDIMCAIAFGYADESHPANQFRTERASVEEVIRWH